MKYEWLSIGGMGMFASTMKPMMTMSSRLTTSKPFTMTQMFTTTRRTTQYVESTTQRKPSKRPMGDPQHPHKKPTRPPHTVRYKFCCNIISSQISIS